MDLRFQLLILLGPGFQERLGHLHRFKIGDLRLEVVFQAYRQGFEPPLGLLLEQVAPGIPLPVVDGLGRHVALALEAKAVNAALANDELAPQQGVGIQRQGHLLGIDEIRVGGLRIGDGEIVDLDLGLRQRRTETAHVDTHRENLLSEGLNSPFQERVHPQPDQQENRQHQEQARNGVFPADHGFLHLAASSAWSRTCATR